MKIDSNFPAAMAELKAAESTPRPDAKLIAHCERYERVADNLRSQFQEIAETGFVKSNLRRDFNEATSLATSITDATPVTPAGRFAKAQAALTSLAGREGIHFQMAAAALQEYMANDKESRPFMPGQLPENDAVMWDQAERAMMRMYRLMSDDQKHELQRYMARKFEKSNKSNDSAGLGDAELDSLCAWVRSFPE